MGGPTFSWWMIPAIPLMFLAKLLAPIIRLCAKFWYISVPVTLVATFFAGKYFG